MANAIKAPLRARISASPPTKPTSASPPTKPTSAGRLALLRWTAELGAVSAEAWAARERLSLASARSQLAAATKEGLVVRHRPLTGGPSLYTVTRAGSRAGRVQGLELCRVTAANARHLATCAAVAAALGHCYPDHRVEGERELRRRERERGALVASVAVGTRPDGSPAVHRPDLVLWPRAGLPVAVEVELTVKAPRRLSEICRAWARSRSVAGVVYLVAPEVEPAVTRACESARVNEQIAVVGLAALALDASGIPSDD